MIKNHNTRKLAVTPSHKKAMMRNMTTSLFLHEKITTTIPRAKEVVRFAERLITKAKSADLNAKKTIHSEISNKDVVKKVFAGCRCCPAARGRSAGRRGARRGR